MIIDAYGGWGAHGGDTVSAKVQEQIDRSAARICRQMAKAVVRRGLCSSEPSCSPPTPLVLQIPVTTELQGSNYLTTRVDWSLRADGMPIGRVRGPGCRGRGPGCRGSGVPGCRGAGRLGGERHLDQDGLPEARAESGRAPGSYGRLDAEATYPAWRGETPGQSRNTRGEAPSSHTTKNLVMELPQRSGSWRVAVGAPRRGRQAPAGASLMARRPRRGL